MLRTHPAIRGAVRRAIHISRDVMGETRFGYRQLLRNLPARLRFTATRPALSAVEAQVASDLALRGISIVPASELLGDATLLKEASDLVHTLTPTGDTRELTRAQTADDQSWDKDFLIRLNRDGATLNLDHILLRLGLHERILNPINAYLGLHARLYYVDAWYTAPAGQQVSAKYSQVWHRDPEDKKLVKVFLYTSDVDETAGPLQYVPGSKLSGGPYSRFSHRRTQLYPDLTTFHDHVPASEVITCTVPAGTFVFCDTSGFHRGGLATATPRSLATWMYVTHAALAKRRFRLDPRSRTTSLPPTARAALA